MVKLIKIYELSPDKATAANMTSNNITKYTRERVVYWQNILTSGKCGDSDKGIYSFKIFKISIITIRITYHRTRLEKGR